MKCIVVIPTICLVFTGCAHPKQNHEKTAMVREMRLAYLKRATSLVPLMDDGISDASTIACAISFSANTEYEAWVAAAVEDAQENAQVKRMLRDGLRSRDGRVRATISIVLTYRANRRN